MATKLHGMGLSMLLGLLASMPCFGLIILLVVNSKATQVLRQTGYRLSLLGAKL